MATHNIYTVNQRIADLQSRVLALETANQALRLWVLAELSTKINDSRSFIQSAVAVDFRNLQDEFGGKFNQLQASIHQGVDGAQGIQGVRGDCTIPNESEIASALLALRKNHARVLADIKYRLELAGGHHRGMDQVLKIVLQSIQRDLENGVQ
jgi:hypothetical protein